MSRFLLPLVALLSISLPSRAQPTTNPVPKPTATEVTFADDTLKFTVPAGWQVLSISEDTRWVQMRTADGKGLLAVNTTPQEQSLTQNPDSREQIGRAIVKQMHQQLVDKGLPIINAPTLKRDDAFFLRIEDRFRQSGDTEAARLHLYRVIGIHFLMVVAHSFDDTPENAAAVWKAGERTILSVKPNKVTRNRGVPTGQKPAIFGKAGVTLAPAKGWLEERSDAPEGIITTYRQPIGEATVTVRAVQLAVQGDDLKTLAARIGAEDLAAVKVESATPAPPETTTADGKFLSRSQQKHARLGPTVRVENRVLAVGNTLLSITSLCHEAKAIDVSTWADALGNTAEPFGKR